MAMIKLGAGITEINGTMGGTVYRRDQCGQHAQTYPRLIDHEPSPAQRARRNAFRQCMAYIRSSATVVFVALWQQYANLHTTTNLKGETRTLTWHQMFLKINIVRLVAGVPLLEWPPE